MDLNILLKKKEDQEDLEEIDVEIITTTEIEVNKVLVVKMVKRVVKINKKVMIIQMLKVKTHLVNKVNKEDIDVV